MPKAFRHTGVLMMIAVVALGLVGAAYALWFEDLQLTANVSTGTLNADVSIHPWSSGSFGAATSTDGTYTGAGHPVVAQVTGTNPPTVTSLLTSNYDAFTTFPGGKPPTTCDAAIGSGLTANDTADHNLLTLNLGGLYPYAGCEYTIDIHSTGSVPIHIGITGVTLKSCTSITGGTCNGAQDVAPAPWSIGLPSDASPQCVAFLGAVLGTTPSQIMYGTPSAPVQLHQGDEVACRFKLILDQVAGAEGKFYQFQATYKAYQWNEQPF